MAIRADSYSSTGEVREMVRHLLDGYDNFNTTTRPTLGMVEQAIDYASSQLNLALWARGQNPASIRANSTAKTACDAWVTAEAGRWVEMTQRGQGYDEGEGSRTGGFRGLRDRAETFVRNYELGFKRMGITPADASSQGLTFTGLTAPADRADPDDTTLAQPWARRGQFDDATLTAGDDD